MWIKCSEKLPDNNGIYLTVHRLYNRYNIYKVARYMKNLGDVIGLEEYDGINGFYDSDPEWGNSVIEPNAWAEIEKYEE